MPAKPYVPLIHLHRMKVLYLSIRKHVHVHSVHCRGTMGDKGYSKLYETLRPIPKAQIVSNPPTVGQNCQNPVLKPNIH